MSERSKSTIKVAVAGAAGRMGQTVCEAVTAAEDMELVGRADPLLETKTTCCESGDQAGPSSP